MNNRYKIVGDTTILYLDTAEGEVESYISTSDLKKVMEFPAKWGLNKWSANKNKFYVKAEIKVDGARRTVMLHRFLMDSPEGLDTDHKDTNGLNNRRDNLRVCTRSQNLLNPNKKARSDSTTSQRGITNVKGRFRVRVVNNEKKRVTVGQFATIEEAIEARDKAEASYRQPI